MSTGCTGTMDPPSDRQSSRVRFRHNAEVPSERTFIAIPEFVGTTRSVVCIGANYSGLMGAPY